MYEQRKNVILSEEWWFKVDLPSLKAALKDWDVRVVVSYRRLWGWLTSLFKETRKMDKMKTDNRDIQFMPSFIQAVLLNKDYSHEWKHYTEALAMSYGQHFNVSIWNYHEAELYPTSYAMSSLMPERHVT